MNTHRPASPLLPPFLPSGELKRLERRHGGELEMTSLSTAAHCKIGPSPDAPPLDLSRASGLEVDENGSAFESSPPDYLHLDIIDGHFFSPDTTFGSEMVQTLRDKLPNAFLDVHMMVKDPENWVNDIVSAGANQFTFHIEATDDPSALISRIEDKGMKAGVAIKPSTPVEAVLPHAGSVEMILVMTTEPGVKGQGGVSSNALHKVETLRQKYPDLLVKTDGWEQPTMERVPTTNNQQEGESDDRSSTAVEPRLQDVATDTGRCTPQTCSTRKARGQHSHRNYGALATNGGGAWCARSDESCGTVLSESQPLLATQSKEHSSRSLQCECHVTMEDDTARRAKMKLVAASVIALLFMIGEVLGGYFSGSLAIMTDAAHMLSDFAGFLISLFAIWLGSRPSSNRMSFGWHRAEVVGAVVSVLIIWVVTGVLFYEAVQRVIHPIHIDADIMLITACVGVFVNVFMCMVLHPHSHGHGHKKKRRRNRSDSDETSRDEERGGEGREEESGRGQKQRFWQRLRRKRHAKQHGSEENINVRAAFIHVIGDLIQSIGVVIAGYIISYKPEWSIADPICTFIFCILVLISTLNVLKDALRVLMEGTPKHINYKELKEDLEGVAGVRKAHSLHVWSLTVNKTALAAHLVIESSANHQAVLNEASQMLKEKYNIISTTLQVEDHHDLMEECGTCQETDKAEFCNFTCWPL